MADACRNCLHWRDPRDGKGAAREGQCRALPPQAVVELDERAGRAQWPLTAASDVCGGHRPSGAADEDAVLPDAPAETDAVGCETKTGLLSGVFNRGKGKAGKAKGAAGKAKS
jgi:hypothetical protein